MHVAHADTTTPFGAQCCHIRKRHMEQILFNDNKTFRDGETAFKTWHRAHPNALSLHDLQILYVIVLFVALPVQMRMARANQTILRRGIASGIAWVLSGREERLQVARRLQVGSVAGI